MAPSAFQDLNDIPSIPPDHQFVALAPRMSENPSDEKKPSASVLTEFVVVHNEPKSPSGHGKIIWKFLFKSHKSKIDDDVPVVAKASKVEVETEKPMRNQAAVTSGAPLSSETEPIKDAPSTGTESSQLGFVPETSEATAAEKITNTRKRGFSLSLSKEEIEADFLIFNSSKQKKRPKNKGPRRVQKELECLFPGLPLSSMTPESCMARYATRPGAY